MGRNNAYLESETSELGDEVYTPFYAVDPLLEFISKDKIIWCPFDEEWSAFVQTFKERGNKVICSHLEKGQDFFSYEPTEYYDIIVSNPPFSKKDDMLKRLYELNKPFAMLLPANSIQGKKHFNIFHKDIQMLTFDTRVDYHTRGNMVVHTKGNHFGSAYFCRDLLPERLVCRFLNKYEKELWEYIDIKIEIDNTLKVLDNTPIFFEMNDCIVCAGVIAKAKKLYPDDDVCYYDGKIYKQHWHLFKQLTDRELVTVSKTNKKTTNEEIVLESIIYKI